MHSLVYEIPAPVSGGRSSLGEDDEIRELEFVAAIRADAAEPPIGTEAMTCLQWPGIYKSSEDIFDFFNNGEK